MEHLNPFLTVLSVMIVVNPRRRWHLALISPPRISLIYHVQKDEKGLYLEKATIRFNGATVASKALSDVVEPTDGRTLASTFAAPLSRPATLNTKSWTLTTAAALSIPSTILSWNGDSPVTTFGKLDPSAVGLPAGSDEREAVFCLDPFIRFGTPSNGILQVE